MRRLPCLLCCLLLTTLPALGGCGQKGPLTLPPARPGVPATAASVPSPPESGVTQPVNSP